jgi:hypothetical protein
VHGASIGGGGGGGGAPHRPGRELRTLEDGRGELQIPGLTEVLLATQSDAQEACRRGAARRRTGANAIHADSSRSHAVLRLSVRAALDDTPLAKLNLVDLAGSERASGAWAAAAAAAATIPRQSLPRHSTTHSPDPQRYMVHPVHPTRGHTYARSTETAVRP